MMSVFGSSKIVFSAVEYSLIDAMVDCDLGKSVSGAPRKSEEMLVCGCFAGVQMEYMRPIVLSSINLQSAECKRRAFQ